MWVLAIYRATGQTDKPVPPSQVKKDARPGENSVRTTTCKFVVPTRLDVV